MVFPSPLSTLPPGMENDKSAWKDSDVSVETIDKRMDLMVMWRGKLVTLWQMSEQALFVYLSQVVVCFANLRLVAGCCSLCRATDRTTSRRF